MAISLAELDRLLTEPEGEHLEFKTARNNYHFEKLLDYCAAISNDGGGKVILSVTDERPRTVTGTTVFAEPGRAVSGLMEHLRIRVAAWRWRTQMGAPSCSMSRRGLSACPSPRLAVIFHALATRCAR